MERPSKIQQLYAYAVCLVAVIERHKMANPGYRYIQRPGSYGERTVYDTISEEQARQRYEFKRGERLAKVRYETTRELLTDVVLFVVALALFVGHWRWLKSLAKSADISAT